MSFQGKAPGQGEITAGKGATVFDCFRVPQDVTFRRCYRNSRCSNTEVMRKIRRPTPAMIAVTVMMLLLLMRFLSDTPATSTREQRNVRVAIVYDGDTFETDTGERVRFRGVDAPEVAHHDQQLEHYGNESTAWLTQLIGGKVVRLAIELDQPEDRYGRTLAWVYLADGTMVNEALLRTGNAKLLDRFGLPPEFEAQLREAAGAAKSNQLGLWMPPTDSR